MSFVNCTNYMPGIVTLYYSLISLGENSAFRHPAVAMTNDYNAAFSFHQVPITTGYVTAVWNENEMLETFTYHQQWESNHRPFDLEKPVLYPLGHMLSFPLPCSHVYSYFIFRIHLKGNIVCCQRHHGMLLKERILVSLISSQRTCHMPLERILYEC